jgi:hypothetical protein
MVLSKADSNITEKQFREIWQCPEIKGQTLIAENGTKVKIVYPGRPNDGQGADFRDAVIMTGRELQTGDVEFHLRSGDWRGHHHHLDPVYNRVILHIVKHHNSRTGTILQNGKEIPIVVIDGSSGAFTFRNGTLSNERSRAGIGCLNIAGYAGDKYIIKHLDRAGKNRFLQKTERFSSEISGTTPGESLYHGIMEALGYSGNKDAFRELARRAPLELLEMKKDCRMRDETYLFNLQLTLFGRAGFLTAENMERLCSAGLDSEPVKRTISTVKLTDRYDTMSPGSWRLFRIRPCNSPFRRLAAMSYLLVKYRREGLLKGMLNLMYSVSDAAKPRDLEKGLVISTDRISYLGKNRAAEIIVNVLLPFAFAYGENNNEPELSGKSLALYTNYPGLEMNSLVRHMTGQLGLDKIAVNKAIRQQGLIHIYKNLCTRGRCQECPLSEFKTGRDVQRKPVNLTSLEPEETAGSDHGGVIGA